jgi:GTP-binding protein LepA
LVVEFKDKMTDITKIRNFAIIAHIDHGKSTLSDRIISICGGVSAREMKEQILDSLDVERQRGITVKAQAVSLKYNGYTFNLIDTPGHVDFSYEVKRSLSACEGAIILVDATQGVQAQTLANVRTAFENKLTMIPVLNKVDLPSAEPEYVAKQIHELLKVGLEPLRISSKTGFGVPALLDAIVDVIPCPRSDKDYLQALIVDSWFDQHLGIVILARVYNGYVRPKSKMLLASTNKHYRIDSVGVFTPKKQQLDELGPGMTGYIIANIRDIKDCLPGDTICDPDATIDPLPGFVKMKPCVFCGIYPTNKDGYAQLKVALEKLQLNDGGLSVQNSNLPVLGSGFHCGFLGLLHLEVVQQRLDEEFDVDIVTTAPGVFYRVRTRKGEESFVDHPSSLPDPANIEYIAEPWAKVTIFTDEVFIGNVIELCKSKRGCEDGTNYMEQIYDNRYILRYMIPLSEIISDFHDKLKSITQGYGSFEYDLDVYKEGDIVALSIIIQGTIVEPLAMLIHRSKAASHGRWICEQLKEAINREMFPIAIQAAIGGKIIARETVPPYRKDVTAKCYGGDITRKRKLLEKQAEGKKRMKMLSIGSFTIDTKALPKILRGRT